MHTLPSKAFSSILNHTTQQSGKSLHTLIKEVKKANPTMGKAKQDAIAKTIKKLNDDPNTVVTNAMIKSAITAMSTAGHLKSDLESDIGGAIRQVQKLHAAVTGTDPNGSSKPVGTLQAAADKRKQESRQKMKMWALARERRRDEGKGITHSLGLNEWQQSSSSIGKAVEEKEKQRKDKADQDQQKKVIDMMID